MTFIPELAGEKILIFGGAGSLGTKLCQTFLSKRKNQVYSYSRDEAKQWQLKQLFSQQDRELLTTGICDIRDIRQVESIIFAIKPSIIIIASAMKQVDTCEAFPYESVKTNVDGINNILEIVRKYSDLADQQYTKRLTVCFISTDKACLDYHSRIELADGSCKKISEIVKNKESVLVKTFDVITNQLTTSRVTGWFKTKLQNRDMYEVSHKHAHVSHKSKTTKSVWVTEDHKILTERGWVEAKNLLNNQDIVFTGEKAPNKFQMQLLCGTLMGDSCLGRLKNNNRGFIRIGQAYDKKEWIELIFNSLKELNLTNIKIDKEQLKKQKFIRFNINGSSFIKPYFKEFLDIDYKKQIPRELIKNYFSPIFLAAWFIDDGCLSDKNARIATHCFKQKDIEWLSDFLNQEGYETYVQKLNYKNKHYHELRFTVKGTMKLFETISSYIPTCARYKLLEEYNSKFPFKKELWNIGSSETYKDIVKVTKKNYNSREKKDVYCLEVQGTNNFIADGIVVHNCSPVNTYGMCKSIAERLVQNQAVENKKVKYLTVRYGNVVNSKGSIVPLLQEQLKNPGFNLTLTDPRMTRFMMTMEESVELIIQSIYSGSSGDIWIPRLDSMSMSDLFQWFSNKHTRKVEITGIRPGEKIHEVLYNQDESRYIQEFFRGSRAPYYVINKNKLSDIKGFKLHEFSSEHNVISPEVLGNRLEEFFKSGSYQR